MKIQEKFVRFKEEMAESLIEREQEVELALVALLAQENLLLVGPPGVGKSLVLDSFIRWTEGKKFTVLLTKFSTLEDVAGPISVQGLKQDQYRRITTGKLPEADMAFIDEIWKASSAILNTLLRILNEGTYDNGDGELRKVPLKLCVAASNEYPHAQEGGRELNALFDRFLLRKDVKPIATQEGRKKLLWGGDHTPKLSTTLSPTELEAARAEVKNVGWKEEAVQQLEEILRELRKEGIFPGDRRQYKAVGVARAAAWLEGSPEVESNHLEVLSHVLWDDPGEQPRKCAQIVARIANPEGTKVNSFLLEVEEILNATNPKNGKEAILAVDKLKEVLGKLKGISKSPKVKKAQAYVEKKIQEIRLAALGGDL